MKRRSNLPISDEELEAFMQIIEDSFSPEWLNKNSIHPIQILWNRNDELATNELFSLAFSIKELSNTDSQWTKAQIRLAKSKEKNIFSGAIFELLGLNIFHSSENHVKPARLNQAGYDGIVSKSNKQEIRLSLKNYGLSNFQLKFEKKAMAVEQLMLKLLKKYKFPPTQILLDFPDYYPEDKDWNFLIEKLDSVFKSQRNAVEPFSAYVDKKDPAKELSRENSKTLFILIAAPFKVNREKFHPNFSSYSLMITANYHQNEHLNLFSKIEDACANLTRHSAKESENILNSLFIHLPVSISMTKCIVWLSEYFTSHPEKPISTVVLYQPYVGTDLNTNQTLINHSFYFHIRDNKKILEPPYILSVPVGQVSNEFSNLTLVAEHPGGKKETFQLEDKYLYQHGEHYLKMMPDGKGGFMGNIQKVGSGIYTNLVIEIPGQPGSAVIKGRFAPFDELLIL